MQYYKALLLQLKQTQIEARFGSMLLCDLGIMVECFKTSCDETFLTDVKQNTKRFNYVSIKYLVSLYPFQPDFNSIEGFKR